MTLSQRIYILLEVLGFVLLALCSKALIAQLTWRYAGPISLALTLLVLTFYMKRQGLRWADFGLIRLKGLKSILLLFPKVLLVFLAFSIAAGTVLGAAELFQIGFLQEEPAGIEARFGEVRHNLPRYLMWLAIVWSSAAFGEEMFFRGYLNTRLHSAFSGSALAPVIAVVVSAAVFGYGHMDYQGLRGLVLTGAIGIAFGTLFFAFKKNLWPMILFHGLIDSASFTTLYLGLEP